MMNIIFIVAIGVVLLVLLRAAGRDRNAQSVGPGGKSLESSEYVVRLPPRELLKRCLSVEDVDFVTGLRSREVLNLLLTERRRLALEWLRHTRREAGRLFRLHVHSAGQ